MTIWFTADPHFGHARICQFCDRPYDSVQEMNDGLLRNWNGTVAPDDTVWVLGDFALGRREDTLTITRQLHGRKLLVVGNHDGPFDSRPAQRARWTQQYLLAGFQQVLHGPILYQLCGRHPVLLSHFPYEPDTRHALKYAEHHPPDEGLPILHGHVHTAWRLRGRQLNVGVDVQHFRPISEEAVWRAFRDAGILPDGEPFEHPFDNPFDDRERDD